MGPEDEVAGDADSSVPRKGLSLAEGGDWDLNFWVPKEMLQGLDSWF